MAIKTSILTAGPNNHPTTSEEANYWATDFVNGGVLGSLANTSGVAPTTGGLAVNASAGMTLIVGVGVAYILTAPNTQRIQMLRSEVTANINVVIGANASGGTRYDWIYLAHDLTKANAPNTAGEDVGSIYVSRSTSSVVDDNTPPTYGQILVVVTVPNGAAAISNAQIADRRTNASLDVSASGEVGGWTPLSVVPTVAAGATKGNKEVDLLFSGVDLSTILSPGMRFKVNRTGSTPSQSADFESSSSQYATRASGSVSGIVVLDDITIEAIVSPESYVLGGIFSRFDGSNGFILNVNAVGQVEIYGDGADNQLLRTYQSLPLTTDTRVSAVLDMSNMANSLIYFDGISVPVLDVSGSGTSFVQAGPLQIGAYNSTAFFDGRISDVRLWSVARTAAEIRDNMSQQLVGNEANLIGYWKLDGNFNDSTANGNHLTATNGAIATYASHFFNDTELNLVHKVDYSAPNTIVTVFGGKDNCVPRMTLQNPYYSREKITHGFNPDKSRWIVEMLQRADFSQGGATEGTYYNIGLAQLSVPTGAFEVFYKATMQHGAAAGNRGVLSTLSTTNNSVTDNSWSTYYEFNSNSPSAAPIFVKNYLPLTAPTIHYLNIAGAGVSASTLQLRSTFAPTRIVAESAYI